MVTLLSLWVWAATLWAVALGVAWLRRGDERRLQPGAALTLEFDPDLWGGLAASERAAAAGVLAREDLGGDETVMLSTGRPGSAGVPDRGAA